MHNKVKFSILSTVILYLLAGSVSGRHLPLGDLDGNYRVDTEDLLIFDQQWLNPSGCSGISCADFDRAGGVNFRDLAILANNFDSQIPEITLVINEFMAANNNFVLDEDEDDDDWIEIYNYGNFPIDLADMYFTDNLGEPQKWQVPDNNPQSTIIQPHSYKLIWADEEPDEGPLHINFKLNATEGDSIGLFDAAGNLVESVTFGPQVENQSYGRLPDASSNWQYFNIGTTPPPTPGKANAGAPSSGQIVINEIMYHSPNNNDLEEYIEIYNQGTTTVNMGGWHFIDGINFTFPSDQTIGAQQYLVVAADVPTFQAKYPGITNVRGGWTGKLSDKGEKITLVDEIGIVIDEVLYADEGDWAVRELGPVDYGHRGWIWSDEHDGGGKSLELINPAMPNQYGQNWTASLIYNGTPGNANSITSNDIAPIISDVKHQPMIPHSDEQVTITAQVIDEQATGITVTLNYRVDGAASFSSKPMEDNGLNGDDDAGDGIYGATIDAIPDGTIMEFFIAAGDTTGHDRLYPASSMVDSVPQQVTNILYIVDNSFDPVWVPGSKPIYYIIMTAAERAELEEISDADSDPFTGEGRSDAQMNATFISLDGTDMKMRYNVGVRNRGNRSRVMPPMNYHINFRNDDPWKDVTGLNINSDYGYDQVLGSAMYRLAGIRAPDAALVEVRVNGVNLSLTDWNRMYGYYAALEAYDSDYTQGHYPEDPDGNLYRCAYYRNNVDPMTYADLIYRGTNPDDYVLNYKKQTNDVPADYNDIFALTFALSPEIITGIPDPNFFEQVKEIINVEEWARNMAIDSLLGNNEGSLVTGDGDDYAMYRGMNDTRFLLLPHDIDTILGQGSSSANIARSIFSFGNVDGLYRLLNDPQFVQIYYRQYVNLLNNEFDPNNFNRTIERILGNSNVPQSVIDAMKQYQANRAANVLTQIPREFSTGCNLSKSGGYYRTTTDTAIVSGTADAVKTKSVIVNGQQANWNPITGQWALGEGGGEIINQVTLAAEDAAKKVLIPSGAVPDAWRAENPFDDSGWDDYVYVSGRSGSVGYENSNGYQNYISYNVRTTMFSVNSSCLIRIPFNVTAEDLASFNFLTLQMRYDDGFVAFINGQKVASIYDPTPLVWNSKTINGIDHEASLNFDEFPINNQISLLHEGVNMLAIHGLNVSSGGSSDFLISARLIAGTMSTGSEGVPLNPGINRAVVQTFDGPDGTGNELEKGYIDIWYDTGYTNDYPKVISGMGGDGIQAQDVSITTDPNINLIVRDSFLPGTPVLVRVEVLNDEGSIDRDLWDATATLSVSDNPGITFSPNQVTLRNGSGSALVTFNGSGNFTLTATVGGSIKNKTLTNLQGQPVTSVSGTIAGNTTWSGIIHITSDVLVPAGVKLTVNPGTLVLIDGIISGETGTDIDIQGTIESLGTAQSPVTFTAYNSGQCWGEIHHLNASPSLYQYTKITRAGNSPKGGHTNSGPAVRVENSTITFEFSSITDNVGKVMQSGSGSDLTFRRCQLARSVMGPEISGSALLFEDSSSTEMYGPDDNDGIYLHQQNPGQELILRRSVFADGDDDALDTMSAIVQVEDCIFRDFVDKGISLYHNEITINRALIANNGIGIQAKGDAAEENVYVNADHVTIKSIQTVGGEFDTDVGIYAFDKFGQPAVHVYFNVTNSIISAGHTVVTDYDPAEIQVTYSNLYNEPWPGIGNVNADPLFVNSNNDFHLQPGSPSIGAGFMGTDQGYYYSTDVNLPEGYLTEDTVWTAMEGPYRVIGELTVPPGITLTIGPGTTVYFEPGTSIIVNGIIDANGAQYQHIRMTSVPGAPLVPDIRPELPYGPPKWKGILLQNTMSPLNRIAFADIEYAQDETEGYGSVGLANSQAIIRNDSFAGTHLQMISTENSSVIISNCTFADMFAPDQWPHLMTPPLDNVSEHINATGGIPPGGHYIIENNIFGKNKGHNDVIDFTGHSNQLPVVQVLNNVFTGGGDEMLDLGGDAYIEGNIFQHVHKDISNTSAGNSNAISTGDDMPGEDDAVITVVRNTFYDLDYVVTFKNNTFMNFENNTVIDIAEDADGMEYSAINFYNPNKPQPQGKGAYLNNNIFWDTPHRIFGNVDVSDPYNPSFSTDLQMHYSLIPPERAGDTIASRPGTIMDLGIGNIAGAPIFADYNDNLSLLSMSPAKATGYNGIDMGADVPAGVKISGEPNGFTCHTNVTLTVSGPGITDYIYKVNEGSWSTQRPVAEPISLTGLSDGQTYTVYALGRNAAGQWQSEPAASKTWTVDTSYWKLVINEVLAHSHGTAPDMIELYYDGPGPLDMGGMSISDNPDIPRKYVFPEPTYINPGDYAVYYADTNAALPNPLGFSLDSYGEGVYLYDSYGSCIDSIEFGIQLNDLTIGRLDDEQWHQTIPTFGQKNIVQPMGDARKLKINEFLANADVLFNDDFVEIYNPTPLPVDMGGMYLTDDPASRPDRHQVKQFTFVPAEGFSFFYADGENDSRTNHLNFKLSSDQGFITLFDEQLNKIDLVHYYSQTFDVSSGRLPDGSDTFEFFSLPTPEISNQQDAGEVAKNLAILNSLRITEIMYNPFGNNDDLEFIELYNTGSTTLDLSGVQFIEGINFIFPQGTTLPADGYLLVVSNPAAFKALYTGVPFNIIYGPYDDHLSNNGEDILLTLAHPFTAAIMRFAYDKNWYPTTNAGGDALAIIDPTAHPKTWDKATSWQAAGPTPGQPTPTSSEWTVLTYDDFESGMGHYSTGGADCLYYIAGTYAHQGNCAVNIQANSGDASSFFHTSGIDVDTPGYTQIKVDFWYYPLGMETGESFQVKYFDGSVWQTAASFVSGTDFDNNSFHYASVLIDEGTGAGEFNFPAGMKIKFQCVASSNTDDIYIDQVKVSAK